MLHFNFDLPLPMKITSQLIAALSLAACFAAPIYAQEIGARISTVEKEKSGELTANRAPLDKEEIAKQLANPIANMISVPIQFEYNRGMGANQQGKDQTVLLQPVAPINLGGGDIFIIRPILAAVNLNSVGGQSGLGVSSMTIESFYAPYTGSSWIWGVGPYLSAPLNSNGYYGSQQTGVGVTAVVLNRDGPWTYGLLGYQSWSAGGDPTYGTQNNLYGQPFLAYTTKDSWTYSANMQAQYNYDAHRTSNPLFVGVSKLEVFGELPVQFSAGAIYYLSSIPGGAAGWGARATVTFVLPK